MQYYYYTSAATETLADRTMAFDPTGMVVTATYANGSSKVIDNAKLSFSALPAKPVLRLLPLPLKRSHRNDRDYSLQIYCFYSK